MDFDSDEDDERPRGGLGAPKKRKQSEMDRVYGVFADTPMFDNDDDPRFGKKFKKEKTVMFKQGETEMMPNADKVTVTPARGESEVVDKDMEEVDERFRFDVKKAKPREMGPRKQAKNDLDEQEMEASYGKGFAMLKKMGFKGGGLGKNEDGIANPIQVKVRKKNQAIQNKGEKVAQDLYGTGEDDSVSEKRSIEELLEASNLKNKKEPRPSDGWKRSAKEKRPKVVYKTAQQVADEQKPQAMRIVDMRGPEVRVVSSLSEAVSSTAEPEGPLKELKHNIRLLIGEKEARMQTSMEEKRQQQDRLIALSKEKEKHKAADGFSESNVANCARIVTSVSELWERQDQDKISLSELTKAFRKIKDRYPSEYKVLDASEVLLSLAAPLVRKNLSGWKPLKDPAFGIENFRPILELLGDREAASTAAFFDVTVVPEIRAALRDWNVREFESCIRIFDIWGSLLPKQSGLLAADVVLPRLKFAVEEWNPLTDQMPIHIWLHPWLPVLRSHMDCLWTPIRCKLSECLEDWDPSDRSAHAILQPWHNVFDARNWEALMEKILDKLREAAADLVVKPGGQDLDPLHDVLAWVDLFPTEALAHMLDAVFLPRWVEALQKWLSVPGCDYDEVLTWYKGWRALMPPKIREHYKVQKRLAFALSLMQRRMAGEEEPTMEAPPSPSKKANEDAPASKTVTLSLREYLEQVAGEKNLEMKPKKSQHNGLQVYAFGNVSIYLDQNAVFLLTAGEWKAVSFDELLRRAVAKVTGPQKGPQKPNWKSGKMGTTGA